MACDSFTFQHLFFRIWPNGTEVSRYTDNDMTLCGYHIPAGTHVDLNPVNFCFSRILHQRCWAVFEVTQENKFYIYLISLMFFFQIVHYKDPQMFPDPDVHLPERWLRVEEIAGGEKTVFQSVAGTEDKINPFLLTPFGHGTRMCAGRR